MSKHRRAANVDKNQGEIVKTLRQCGLTVETGHDDILVGHNRRTWWFELKEPGCVGKDGRIRHNEIKPSQKKLACAWAGHYRIVWTAQQIIDEVLHGKVDPMTVIPPDVIYRWRVENGW